MKIEIKKCLENNIETVCEIDKTSSSYNWTKRMFVDELNNENSSFKLLFVDGIIAGYIIYRTVIDETEILNIVIADKFKGKKFGTYLLKETIEELKNEKVKTVFLEVGEKNIVAIALYQKFGFKIYNKRINYYKNQETALLMKTGNDEIY